MEKRRRDDPNSGFRFRVLQGLLFILLTYWVFTIAGPKALDWANHIVFRLTLPSNVVVEQPPLPPAPRDEATGKEDGYQMIRDALAARFVDPQSTQFRNMTYYEDSIALPDGTSDIYARKICGEFNTKNRLGGYAGYRPFFGIVFYTDSIDRWDPEKVFTYDLQTAQESGQTINVSCENTVKR